MCRLGEVNACCGTKAAAVPNETYASLLASAPSHFEDAAVVLAVDDVSLRSSAAVCARKAVPLHPSELHAIATSSRSGFLQVYWHYFDQLYYNRGCRLLELARQPPSMAMTHLRRNGTFHPILVRLEVGEVGLDRISLVTTARTRRGVKLWEDAQAVEHAGVRAVVVKSAQAREFGTHGERRLGQSLWSVQHPAHPLEGHCRGVYMQVDAQRRRCCVCMRIDKSLCLSVQMSGIKPSKIVNSTTQIQTPVHRACAFTPVPESVSRCGPCSHIVDDSVVGVREPEVGWRDVCRQQRVALARQDGQIAIVRVLWTLTRLR